MRNFLRTLKYALPYRGRLAASFACALAVAVLWSLNLSAIYPVLQILTSGKNLQQWVEEEIDSYQKELKDPVRLAVLEKNRAELREIEQTPDIADRETRLRKVGHEITKGEAELSYYGGWVYRYRLLRDHVIRHLPEDRFATFLWIMAAVVVCVAVKGVFEFLHESLVGSVANRTLFDLRNRFFRRVVHQDVRQLSAATTTDLMARFTNDLEQLGLGLKILFGRMIAEPLKALGCVAVACYISWQLTIVFCVLIPLAMYTLMRVSKAMRKAARKVLERMSAIYKLLRETFDGIRAVKAFTRESHERLRFRKATEEYYRKAMRVVHIDAFANPMIELLGVLAVGLALAAGTYLVVSGQTHIFGVRMTAHPLGFATLLQLYAFLAAIADPVRKLSSVYTKLQAGEAAANRVFEVFDRVPSVGANPAGPRIPAVRKGIEFRNVCFSYHPGAETPTLDRVDLAVTAGETVAVVGPNGCGKTTLLGLLPRFYDPDHGAVFVDGVNVRQAHLRTLRRRIGLVTQDTQLFDDTVFANIAYGKKGATEAEVVAAAKQAHAHDFIERDLPYGYQTMVGELAGKISGGQRQRIALARAVLRNPDILILDEFTSQVDPHSEAEIHAALKEFVTGRTVFMITHRLHAAAELADRIVVMDAGRIVAVGTHPHLLATCPLYRRLCDPGQRTDDPPPPGAGSPGPGDRPVPNGTPARGAGVSEAAPAELTGAPEAASTLPGPGDRPPSDNSLAKPAGAPEVTPARPGQREAA
ncbi:MAG TPA: ABC transporter ATP-binding protein [Urbifossiella sp.]|nr:ABC transporter ATP-binding protein [Urbifossiella sp.]